MQAVCESTAKPSCLKPSIRVCVDCGASLGHVCPFCGDTRLKLSKQKDGSVRCQWCWKNFRMDKTTGGFCDSCLFVRLSRVKGEINALETAVALVPA